MVALIAFLFGVLLFAQSQVEASLEDDATRDFTKWDNTFNKYRCEECGRGGAAMHCAVYDNGVCLYRFYRFCKREGNGECVHRYRSCPYPTAEDVEAECKGVGSRSDENSDRTTRGGRRSVKYAGKTRRGLAMSAVGEGAYSVASDGGKFGFTSRMNGPSVATSGNGHAYAFDGTTLAESHDGKPPVLSNPPKTDGYYSMSTFGSPWGNYYGGQVPSPPGQSPFGSFFQSVGLEDPFNMLLNIHQVAFSPHSAPNAANPFGRSYGTDPGSYSGVTSRPMYSSSYAGTWSSPGYGGYAERYFPGMPTYWNYGI